MLSRTTVSVLFCMAWASCTEAPRSTFPATHAPELKSLPLRSDLIGSSSLQFTDDGGDSIFVKCVGETCRQVADPFARTLILKSHARNAKVVLLGRARYSSRTATQSSRSEISQQSRPQSLVLKHRSQ